MIDKELIPGKLYSILGALTQKTEYGIFLRIEPSNLLTFLIGKELKYFNGNYNHITPLKYE